LEREVVWLKFFCSFALPKRTKSYHYDYNKLIISFDSIKPSLIDWLKLDNRILILVFDEDEINDLAALRCAGLESTSLSATTNIN